MGNRLEELALAQYMPQQFKIACPHCKQPWTVNRIDTAALQIECRTCNHYDLSPHPWGSANSGCYVHDANDAWRKIWREFVFFFGLRGAISKASQAPGRRGHGNVSEAIEASQTS